MDYQTVKQKLSLNLYENIDQFKEDVLLIFDNCVTYNGTFSYVGAGGVKTKEYFLKIFEESKKKNLLRNEDIENVLQI